MADNFRVFLFGNAIDKPHVRLDHGKYLVVSPHGTKKASLGFPDGRAEKQIELTTAAGRRLAIRLLDALEPEL